MSFDFPSSPAEGQQFTPVGGVTYVFHTPRWMVVGGTGTSTVAWTDITGKPSTFPPTLPITEGDVTNLVSDLGLKAPLASPTFTGVPAAPTAGAGTSTTQLATTAFVAAAVGGVAVFTTEDAQDATAALIQNGTGITWSYNDAAGTLTPTVTVSPGAPGGANTQVQYNNSGAFGGSANLVWNNATSLMTLTGQLAINLGNAMSIVAAGAITANNYVCASTIANLAPASAGAVLLRPNGPSNATAQLAVFTTGVTATTPITLPADPTAALQAATKQYVDAAVVPPATVAPLMDGTAAVGIATKYAREDHKHPTDTSREAAITVGTTAQYWRGDKSFQTLDKTAVGLGNVDNTSDAAKPVSTAGAAADALRVLKAGDVMTGGLNITGVWPTVTNRLSIAVATVGSNPGLGNASTGIELGNVGGAAAFFSRDVGFGSVLFLNINGASTISQFACSGTTVGNITITTTTTAYNTSSDLRLKEDLKSFDAGNIIDETEVYDFQWKETESRAFGVIAQEAVKVYPLAVSYDDTEDRWYVDYSKYVPVILQELKALRKRVMDLEGKG